MKCLWTGRRCRPFCDFSWSGASGNCILQAWIIGTFAGVFGFGSAHFTSKFLAQFRMAALVKYLKMGFAVAGTGCRSCGLFLFGIGDF